jgi:hypothetical protein
MSLLNRIAARVATRRLKTYQDALTYRLTQIIPGMVEDFKVWQLRQAIELVPDHLAIIEIGSFCGRSTNLFRYFLDQAGKDNPIFNCDIWNYAFKGMGPQRIVSQSPVTGDGWADHARETFKHHAQFFSGHKLPHSFQMPSVEFFKAWQNRETHKDLFGSNVVLGGKVGLCFIDGNHAYEAVKEDFAVCDAALDKDGLILFDDSGWPYASPGVAQFMTELKNSVIKDGRYEIVSRNPHYLIRKN